MQDLKVEIVKLGPMRVATALGFGSNPEELAFEKMVNFAQSNGLLEDGRLPVTYGFNNPDPSPGSPNYGYEVWLPVDTGVKAAGEIKIIEYPGGDYAATRFQGVQKIGDMWKQLVRWQEKSKYQRGNHQWLEKLFNPWETNLEKLDFELYLPLHVS